MFRSSFRSSSGSSHTHSSHWF